MKKTGFEYYLEKEILRNYQKKPLELRLKWLYQANKLKSGCTKEIIEKFEKFRTGKI
ncbi:MAG: hypothetical protein ABIH40_01235 [Candidatus Omnitrophota bacterium]